ncbi:ATP-dependent DNA helicase PcrA [Geodia barretti]|uniref:DNA 3'-5' helicase n=1 Tax=Geodia barretti TaxID=519541 RepID=A0AA35R1T1_GEOBA|nr:ATP-dependent DNA helicase PcrA [Geodia barretti]
MSLQPQFSERPPRDVNGPASAPYWEEPASSPYWDAPELAEHLAGQSVHGPEPDASPAILQGLNEAQQQAVLSTEGPLLIIAGPGSGKTRVITHRIAYLVEECGVNPWQILAVTFTNKAAREMRNRLDRLLLSRSEAVTMGTFHAVCSRILRRHGDRIGLNPNFTIYDQDDQIDAIKSSMQLADVDTKRFPPRAMLSRISAAKSTLQESRQMRESAYAAEDEYGANWIETCSRVYHYYEEALSRQNALDFDDLLMRTASLLKNVPEVRAQYHERYRYLLIDEFQDTNIAQYQLARLLTGTHQNLCVVGDPDQSIYSWRNADIRNILSFQSDYPDATVISLGENYRSTKNILQAASSVIAANTERIERPLFTGNPAGRPITLHEAYSADDEAAWAVDEVTRLTKTGEVRAGDCAIMYRINAQSRAFEDQCMRQGMPYRLVGGVRFYHRKEIKDAVSYLRVIYNPDDEVSLRRVINNPPRGIGAKTAQLLTRFSTDRGNTMLAAMQQIADARTEQLPCPISVTARAAKSIADLAITFQRLRDASRELAVADLLDRVLDMSGLARHIQADENSEDRWDNVQELRALAEEYGPSPQADGLGAFLERVSLVSDVDSYEQTDDALTLITLHQAKGLEFPVVMIAGMEEGLLPHSRSLDTIREIEEERRLCYVGMTRAMQRLYLLRAFSRPFPSSGGIPSRFLQDVPEELLASPALERPPGTRADTHPLNPSRPSRNEDAVIGGSWATSRRESRTRRGEAGEGTTGGATRGHLRGDIDEKLTEWVSSRPPRAPQPERIPLTVGEIVRHSVFGEGVVQDVQGVGDDEQVTVNFSSAGLKRLLVSLARLERG